MIEEDRVETDDRISYIESKYLCEMMDAISSQDHKVLKLFFSFSYIDLKKIFTLPHLN